MKIRILVMIMLMFAINIHAMTAAQFESECGDVSDTPGNFCTGYLKGVIDGFMFTRPLLKDPIICFPKEGTTTDHVRYVVLKYIEQNPMLNSKDIVPVVLEAAGIAFPCINKK